MIASFILPLLALAFVAPCDNPDLTAALKTYVAKYPDTDFTKDFVFVSVEKQCLYHFHNWELVDSYPVSTGKAGMGCASGSNMTPSGLHIVKEI